MRRAKPFFLGFPRKTKGSSQRAMRVVKGPFYFHCMFLSWFASVNIVIGHLGRPRSTQTAPMPAPMDSVHAQIIRKSSRAGLAVSRSELVEPGAATCVFRGMAGPCLQSLKHTRGTSSSI